MTPKSVQRTVWDVVRAQHGVVTRGQLAELGFGREAVRHRVARGRLHPVWPGVYAVGRPELTREGRWMAAVLTCGEGAALSHGSAGALWGVLARAPAPIAVSVAARRRVTARAGIRVHRREAVEATRRAGIPVMTPADTLVDLAAILPPRRVEAAVNEADKLGLIDPEALRTALDGAVRRPGTAALRRILDAPTFALTDSELERRFLRVARDAGLPLPHTQARIAGLRVDFHWPDLRLVVEADGLRYHRTPAQQAADRRRDQTLTAAGLTVLRFTHAQVRFAPDEVRETLAAVAGG